MVDNKIIDHKAIFHYLNPEGCWHEWRSMGPDWGYRCGKDCGAISGSPRNPDYTTEHGFFLLLEGLRAKEFEVETHGLNEYTVEIWGWQESLPSFRSDSTHSTDIRIALAEAVMKLIPKDGEL